MDKNLTKSKIGTTILFFSVLCLLFSVSCFPSYAAVPHLINYQGRLTDNTGKPLEGAHQITFRIYDAPAAGNLLWEEIYSALLIQKGIFNVMLGSVSNLNLAFDRPYYLEIKVGTDVMSPRQQFTSSGYAIKAEKAEDLNIPAQQGDMLYFDGSKWTKLTTGPAGYRLQSQGAGTTPVWVEPPSNTSEGSSYYFDTTYTNTTGHKVLVTCTFHEGFYDGWYHANVEALIGPGSPSTSVARFAEWEGDTHHADRSSNLPHHYTLTFVVPNNWSWRINSYALYGQPGRRAVLDRIEAWEI